MYTLNLRGKLIIMGQINYSYATQKWHRLDRVTDDYVKFYAIINIISCIYGVNVVGL